MSEDASRCFQPLTAGSPIAFESENPGIVRQRQAKSPEACLNHRPTGSMTVMKWVFYSPNLWCGLYTTVTEQSPLVTDLSLKTELNVDSSEASEFPLLI